MVGAYFALDRIASAGNQFYRVADAIPVYSGDLYCVFGVGQFQRRVTDENIVELVFVDFVVEVALGQSEYVADSHGFTVGVPVEQAFHQPAVDFVVPVGIYDTGGGDQSYGSTGRIEEYRLAGRKLVLVVELGVVASNCDKER